ncbi:PqiB family protein [Bordetella genomosp. 11]|uniref:Paraquat-inducible protein B n=1 Tax=Bordetella genomosp. 11 TaxID=1416808 RepID=A0A261UH34_9BORD|nr:MlaD family protein [Bordetella genomosp. 11]OZI60530.1 paraquat-inducible protein B [Bordetella genomosp. 11]
MADPDTSEDSDIHDASITRRKRRISWIWLVPIVAALAGGALVLRTWLEAGPTITITFQTAEGLEAGKTQIRYKDVIVGQIESIRLSDDRSHVITTAKLAKDATSLAQEGTIFWVVRPRLGLSGVSGLGTLLSGSYIGVDAPRRVDNRRPKTEFAGLELPPEVLQDRPGKRFRLRAGNLGSLDIGSPVYYRRIPVGQVIGYHLSDDGQDVNIQIFVDAPNDRFVTDATRFWNASGFDFTLSADGLKVRTQSLLSLALGGLAFEDIGEGPRTVAAADADFRIYDSEQSARAKPDSLALKVQMRFDQSVRGLSVGAPIDFNGIALGQVDAIDMDLDRERNRFYALISGTIYPDRLGSIAKVIRQDYMGPDAQRPSGILMDSLIRNGMRAQLRTGNFLTGQLYVALDVFPNAEPATFQMSIPARIPTVPNNLDQLQQQLVSIASKLEKVPFDQIGADVRAALSSAARLMTRLDKQVAPQAQAALREAAQSLSALSTMLSSETGLASNTERAVQELGRTARSLRALSDYLQAHPESLLRGRAPDRGPAAPAARSN